MYASEMNMINKKWMTVGYAAAVISIIAVALLLGTALWEERRGDQGQAADQTRTETGSTAGTVPGLADESEGDKTASSATGRSAVPLSETEADEKESERERAEYEARILSLSGSDLWRLFDGAALTGDSRVVGFSLYTGIADSNVWAQNGATIDALGGFIPQIAAMKPDRVYIAYGINDIKSSVGGGSGEEYASYAEKKIENLEEELGETEIYVNSILPVSPSLQQSDPVYQKVSDYNRELEKMCRRRGWHFIDNSTVAFQYADLYVGDGVHLQAGFYEHWAKNMLLAEPGFRGDEGGTGVDR